MGVAIGGLLAIWLFLAWISFMGWFGARKDHKRAHVGSRKYGRKVAAK